MRKHMTEVFPKAPITEALIDIGVQLPESVSLTDLEKLHSHIKGEYPDKKPRNLWEEKVELKEDGAPHTETRIQKLGYLFTRADRTQVVQFRLDGFTFNRLRPYTRWEDVCPQARKLWDLYKAGVRPVEVTRIAVRYINSIEIPSKSFDFDDYFTATPKVPDGLPQILDHFFMRTQIPFAEVDAKAVVIQTLSNKQDPMKTVILLDIDVFRQENLPPPDDERIWKIFAKFREIKNEIFLKSITEKTKELFR
jgi:uncharacterized protein (TIGR04255 family)